MRIDKPLGEMLIERGFLTSEKLKRALSEQKETGEALGKVLVRLGFLQEEDLKKVLSEQLGISFLSVAQLKPRADQRLKILVPREIAHENTILPIERTEKTLTIACAMIPNVIFLDNLRKMTGLEIKTQLANEFDLKNMIAAFYETTDLQEVATSEAFSKATEGYVKQSDRIDEDLEKTIREAEKGPVVRFVDLLLKKALDDRASDIHIEPIYDKTSIRYRIDGSLYELPPPPEGIHASLVSRVKILSRLNIAEKRLPQDGSFSIQYEGRKIDVRVSTVPLIFGEKVVLRLLDKRPELLDLAVLGFNADQRALFEEAINKPYGLVFLTGPTGSGKSTTLYAALNKIKSTAINIVTIEDPVEYQLSGVNQVQVQPEIGLTFASGLRSFLRQDPDVILVGEVRDQETAEICIRAALTGHLVLSTLHTNDAASAITRLLDIGIQPYLVAGSLLLVVAQRLIRRLCPHCKVPVKPDPKSREEFGVTAETIFMEKERGCDKCRNIGFWGREAIYEFLPVTSELRQAIAAHRDAEEIRKIQKSMGHVSLFQSGVAKVNAGLTSLEEIMSIAYV
ncbi:MAG: GspE/PulE family protein [Candidatus Omnitrophota bacterium]